jgi:hypothetical protein
MDWVSIGFSAAVAGAMPSGIGIGFGVAGVPTESPGGTTAGLLPPLPFELFEPYGVGTAAPSVRIMRELLDVNIAGSTCSAAEACAEDEDADADADADVDANACACAGACAGGPNEVGSGT